MADAPLTASTAPRSAPPPDHPETAGDLARLISEADRRWWWTDDTFYRAVSEQLRTLQTATPSYRLTWIAGARPPAHPEPMTGVLTFASEAEAWDFFCAQASDAILGSLSKSLQIDCGRVQPPANLMDRIGEPS